MGPPGPAGGPFNPGGPFFFTMLLFGICEALWAILIDSIVGAFKKLTGDRK